MRMSVLILTMQCFLFITVPCAGMGGGIFNLSFHNSTPFLYTFHFSAALSRSFSRMRSCGMHTGFDMYASIPAARIFSSSALVA